MSISTLMVLLLLTFGQILALSIGFLILWLAGEFDDSGDRGEQAREQQGSTRVGQSIRATAAGVMRQWQSHVPAFRSDWIRAHRSLIAACVLLIATIGVFVSVGKLKRWQIAHFLPTGLTDGSKSSPR
jgi:hypothetical protein